MILQDFLVKEATQIDKQIKFNMNSQNLLGLKKHSRSLQIKMSLKMKELTCHLGHFKLNNQDQRLKEIYH